MTPSRPAGHTMRQYARLTMLRMAGKLSGSSASPGAAERVLLIRPDHIGDVLLLTPVLHALRRALPGAHIALLVGPWSAEVVRDNPDVNEVVTVAFPGFARQRKSSPLAPYQALRDAARRLRSRAYDTAIVLRFDHWWGAWLATAAGIPRRIGYNWPEVAPFVTERVPYGPGRHETLQNASLVEALTGSNLPLGLTHFTITEDDADWASSWLAERGINPGATLVAIHPGAGAAVKQWPAEHWGVVGRDLQAARNVRLLVTGGAAERELGAAVTAMLPLGTADSTGQSTLGQLAALYGRCALVLGADSGPLHLAVATGAPTIHLFGPVPPEKFGPWGDPAKHVVIRSHWACAPCDRLDWPDSVLRDHGCVAAIPAARVLEAALSLLGGS